MRKSYCFRVLLVPVLFILIQSLNAQTTRYVKPVASGAGTATNWANASGDLQSVIDASVSGDSIFVMKGVYLLTATITMKEGVKIYGGFTAEAQVYLNQRVLGTTRSDSSVLDGNNDKRVVNNNFTAVSPMTAASVLDGFFITNGRGVSDGGGVYNRYASPTIRNCVFSGNVATRYGGGVHNLLSSSPVISNCVFSKNVANNRGGGINNDNLSAPFITHCSFLENTATTELGGAIFSYMSNPIINHCSFSKNRSVQGGGMYNQQSSPQMNDCSFVENTASYGGGLINDGGSPAVIVNCVFSKNTSSSSGGGMVNGASATIRNCTFSENTASGGLGGGGLFNTGTSTQIINCLFIKNISGQSGGGIYQQLGAAVINNCQFLENSTSQNGGGLFTINSPTQVVNSIFWKNRSTVSNNGGGGAFNNNFAQPGNVPSFTGCSFWGNEASWGGALRSDGGSAKIRNCILYGGVSGVNSGGTGPVVFDYSYSMIQGLSGGSNGNLNAPADANLVFTDAMNGDLRLLPSSPAVNSGNNSDVPPGISADLADNQRIAGGAVDMGAYEFGSAALPVSFGNFSAILKNNSLYVDWSTLTETNNDFFDIEISADGKTFRQLASVKSDAPDGNSNTTINYHFEINAQSTTALLSAPVMLILCCFIWNIKNRKIVLVLAVSVLGCILFSCSRKDLVPDMAASKLYIRIAQTDKDGTRQYSKTIVVTRAN